jgi:hypothetical protein
MVAWGESANPRSCAPSPHVWSPKGGTPEGRTRGAQAAPAGRTPPSTLVVGPPTELILVVLPLIAGSSYHARQSSLARDGRRLEP